MFTIKKLFREMTTKGSENLATVLIYSFVKNEQSIYEFNKLRENLAKQIDVSIDINLYQNLAQDEKVAFQNILIEALGRLINKSMNTYQDDYMDIIWMSSKKGFQISHRSLNTNSWGGNLDTAYEDKLKFPDIFYITNENEQIKETIISAIAKTKFDTISKKYKPAQSESVNEAKKSNKKFAINKNEVAKTQPFSLYGNFRLYPSLPSQSSEEIIPTSPRLYPDLEGYDLTPAFFNIK